MDLNEGMAHLRSLYQDKEWFHSVGTDQYGRLVVYVHYMCEDNLRYVVDNVGKTQVLVHFAASKTATREQFVDTPGVPKMLSPEQFLQKAHEAQANGIDTGFGQALEDVVPDVEEHKSILYLQNELERLEKICGSFTLQDIFYEIQDGKNAVTNLSARYPEVRQRMEKLYDMYGFDVIYEELDG